jgi:hypothetical protein
MSILEAFLAGKEARRVADAAEQINAMQQFVGQNGQAIMAGDQFALGQLAGFGVQGLQTAMGIQDNLDVRQDRQYNRNRARVEDGRADQEWQMKVAEHKASLTAEQAAAEAASYENAAKIALTAKTPEDWDRLATENGVPQLVGQFEQREAVAARFMSIAEVLKSQEPPTPLSPEGKLAADVAAGLVAPGTTPTPDTVVNVGGEGDAFYQKLDEAAAAMFSTLQDEGVQAGRTLGLIDRLDSLMQQSPTGAGAVMTRLAGEVGIDVGGLGEVQAIEALINQIVPQQRQPGSGPMSDADLALFKKSVPRLINTPEGNAKIIETMRAINLYVQEQAVIADQVANREITPAEGRKKLKALANPLDGFSAGGGAGTAKPAAPTGSVVVDGFTIEAIE